jgi:hypothetical protein
VALGDQSSAFCAVHALDFSIACVYDHSDRGFSLSDNAQLLPALDRIEERLEKKPQQMVADGGYTTRDNIGKMAGREIDFLASMGRDEMQSGATTLGRLAPSAFLYQSESNC